MLDNMAVLVRLHWDLQHGRYRQRYAFPLALCYPRLQVLPASILSGKERTVFCVCFEVVRKGPSFAFVLILPANWNGFFSALYKSCCISSIRICIVGCIGLHMAVVDSILIV